MVNIFTALFQESHTAKVRFFNWKGYRCFESYLHGDGGFDLFVPLHLKAEVEKSDEREGLRRVVSYQTGRDIVEHYYGSNSKFAHSHLHFKKATRENASKNYLLPLDKYLQDNLKVKSNLPAMIGSARWVMYLVLHFLKIGSSCKVFQSWRANERYGAKWHSFYGYIGHEDIEGIEYSLNRHNVVYDNANEY